MSHNFRIDHHARIISVSNSEIYIIGGEPYVKTAWFCNPEKQILLSIMPMQTARSQMGLVFIKNRIYAIGGWQHNRVLCCCE